MWLPVLIGVALLFCSVLFVFGCVCHIFKRSGFRSFEDDAESGHGVSMYEANGGVHDNSNVTFEPLPDILAKTVGSRALRPRITCADKDRQASAAKLVTVYQPFPRNQLLYIKEIGLGWFGQVLQGSAENIVPDSRSTKVVVKILKDDATVTEKSLFLQEVATYRELDHPNILRLLGQCTETSPYLTILEFPPLGDLKSYLQVHKQGPFLQFAIDAAKGLSCIHQASYIHHDFAARNCLLMSDLSLKVGDYGIGEDLFREDYYDTGCDLLPIRWMSPESLELKQGVWQLTSFTKQSNVWSLSILLWEILAVGRKPYGNLRDEDVLQKVIREGTTKLPSPNSAIPHHDRWYEVMEMCWQEVDDRPSADDLLAFLQQIEEESGKHPKYQHHCETVSPVVPQIALEEQPSSPNSFASSFVQSKNKNQTNHLVAEVLVHRVDENGVKQGFEDDFSQVKIRKNAHTNGFEDDFIAGENFSDSIVAGGGHDDEEAIGNFTADANMNLLAEPVPVGMSTPSKQSDVRGEQSDVFHSALSNQTDTGGSKFVSTSENNRNNNGVNEINKGEQTENKYETQISDQGYGTYNNASTETAVSSTKERSDVSSSEQMSDLETEKAKEIYMSKGAAISPSYMYKSRSLGTIPEDGIPSDNTSISGVVFDDPRADDIGMDFEWDDYDETDLVGSVRYVSDDSETDLVPRLRFNSDGSVKTRQVDVEEWPFDQDSGSEAHSKPGSVASESDAEVTGLSIGSNTSVDTRARIASILSNRLNTHINQTNQQSYSRPSMFYSFSQYENDLESPELAYSSTDKYSSYNQRPTAKSFKASLIMGPDDISDEEEMVEDEYISVAEEDQGQDDQLIKQDLDKIAMSVLNRDVFLPDVAVTEPSDLMLPSATTTDAVA